MSNLTDGLLSQLGSGGIAQIAQALGTDESKAQGAIGSALPAILAGLANNTQKPQGAEALASALEDHSPSVFDQLGNVVKSAGGADGNAILAHVLGQKRGGVEQQLAGQTGLDLGAISKLLPMLAPLVLGYLSKQKSGTGPRRRRARIDARRGATGERGEEPRSRRPGLDPRRRRRWLDDGRPHRPDQGRRCEQGRPRRPAVQVLGRR
ncbi:MAG: DUF937 domain-containing protein [Acidimicrobiales bacterium]